MLLEPGAGALELIADEAAGAGAVEAGAIAAVLAAAGALAVAGMAGFGAAASGAFWLSPLPPWLHAAIRATSAPAIKNRVNFMELLPQIPMDAVLALYY